MRYRCGFAFNKGFLLYKKISTYFDPVKGVNPLVHEEKETKGQIILGNKNSRYSLAFICSFLGVDPGFFCCDK